MFRLIRIISGISVTTLAYLGVKTDFKVDGELTSTGNIVIIAAIILVLTSILLEILEHFRQKRNTREMNEKFENLKYQLSKPMLPFDFRSVIKYTTNEDVIKSVFGEQISSFQQIIDMFKDKGKFIHPGLADFPWDEDHQTNEYILCQIEKEKLQELIQNNSKILKQPFSGTIEIFKKKKDKFSNDADLILEVGSLFQGKMPYTITDLRLYNKNIYLESYIHQWSIKKNTDNVLSIYDLRGAKMKITLDILTHDKSDYIDSIPYLTFLQFKCGDRPFNLIQFDTNYLPKPKIEKNKVLKPNDDETTNEIWADHLTLNYDLILPDKDFEKHIEQYN